ncbi:hypothetical protein H6F98_00620 [Microcoleus sp. FACHB-SPT15]|jgi:hypothetical protein|uniref:hypothetical protein n=1 Tax=Microcoleus sp. FACHB-SPT15 TaxID=2692830 RepID=UPI0017864AF8|nr:hypothetical protein [Microcoleus sp. FACHB-SPT15]MBD1803981.1 hypothetical protein [Microcoleus sp. FACHB-SPT15]
MTIWTKKHTTFSVQNRLTPTARELWQWLLDEIPEGSSEIIDLRDFNKWVKKTRGFPHDPKTVKSAAKQLRDAGVLIHPKSYTAYVWRWTLKSINLLLFPISRPTKKKSALAPQIPDLDPSNPESPVDEAITTTTVLEDSETDDFTQKLDACKKAGIYYEPKDAKFLRSFSLQEVLKAILYFLFNRDGVRKPEGWFKVCLEDNWAAKEEERHQHRLQWSTQGLFDAIRHCNNMISAI